MEAGNTSGSVGDTPDKDSWRGELDWPSIPEELEYLVEPGIRYGRRYEFDDDVQWFVENAEESDLETLAALAERARLSGDYRRFMEWSYVVYDVSDRLVDERYPYTVEVSEKERKELLPLINEDFDRPEVAERWREKRLRGFIEAADRSELAERRREMRSRLGTEANDKVHDMDIYFLFGLMDACDMEFEPE